MITIKFSGALGEIDDKYVDEAIHYQRISKKHGWVKWVSMAACFCVILAAVFVFPQLIKDRTVQVYTLSQTAYMEVALVEWQGEGFKAIVVDTGDNNIFPVNTELTVLFEENTKIILNDGTQFEYNASQSNAGSAGWVLGEIIYVEFLNYEQYSDTKGYSNRVYSRVVEVTTTEVTVTRKTFEAQILEVRENSVLVEPLEGTNERQIANQIEVITDRVGEYNSQVYLEQAKIGDIVRIGYFDEFSESSNTQIKEVYEIVQVSD